MAPVDEDEILRFVVGAVDGGREDVAFDDLSITRFAGGRCMFGLFISIVMQSLT